MVQTTGQRVNWQEFECNEHKLVEMAFGPDRILVTPSDTRGTGLAGAAGPATSQATPETSRQAAAPAQGGGTRAPTGGILTTLIAAFTGLGLIGKIDRLIKILGLAAGKPA
jgi:hypothetical protein